MWKACLWKSGISKKLPPVSQVSVKQFVERIDFDTLHFFVYARQQAWRSLRENQEPRPMLLMVLFYEAAIYAKKFPETWVSGRLFLPLGNYRAKATRAICLPNFRDRSASSSLILDRASASSFSSA